VITPEKKPYSVTWEEIKAILRPVRSLAAESSRREHSAKLTEDQKKAYMENAANLCPFCKSPDITGGSVDIDGREAWQEVSCNECPGEWRDVYTLSFVEDVE
jgi:formate dehydrogenase maturation protein FdhE